MQLSCIGATIHLDLGPAVPNFRYQIEASTNLSIWRPIGTITTPGISLGIDVPEDFSTGSPRWFYRGQLFPPP